MQLYESQDIARRLGVSAAAVRQAARRGALVPLAVTPRGARLFSEENIAAFAARRKRASAR